MQNKETMPTSGALPLTVAIAPQMPTNAVPSLFGVKQKIKAQELAMQAIISIWSKPLKGSMNKTTMDEKKVLKTATTNKKKRKTVVK
jgi:hypothetical protein